MEEISPEIQRYLLLMQKEMEQERTKRLAYENETGMSSSFSPAKEQNLAESQLDLKEELDRIFHLLSGHVITIDENGSEKWIEPLDDRLKIFSDYGVKQIMNIISFYVNKNTLMSFYDEETIRWKMRDFGIELADLIYNRYEAFFHYPTPEDLYEKYLPVIQKGIVKLTEDELYSKCVQWSKEELQSKLRHYPMMVLALVDTVHSTYLRALHGKERTSLRERLNISQSANIMTDNFPTQPQNKTQWYKPTTW